MADFMHATDPYVLFAKWYEEAQKSEPSDANAMSLATLDENDFPNVRIVLMKEWDERGFVFYTNLGSRKAQQLKQNNKISLHFPWHMIERQVHITGVVEELSKREVLTYFSSRPKESQIAAWASKQSQRLTARQALEGKFFELKQKFLAGEVPLPTFWGGFRVKINSIEFWQGGEHRLHDRFLYHDKTEQWEIDRLAP